jgi:hypothetical protein
MFHEWSTESGCRVPGSVLDWCKPDIQARHAELAALTRQATIEYAGWTVGLVTALWITFYTLAWVLGGFWGPQEK